ncbi:hypoxia-inducible factor prolyl hydroxylase-like [Hydractinia symbiolongicarpus]|uniref:hypoxia-inducible factor prolyl hydroxylase-like n=1 Tax=Hydractinia symbiolongicarpus TaxID=13093 RepID=UPI0025517ED7|nr:hypoxia-inducible factor prolyl hydroxylase-like [Hydractinia symbiolongicarpus]
MNKLKTLPNQCITEERCSFCQADKNIRLRCSQCKKTWYCSPHHQKLHWKHHKSSCRSSSAIDFSITNNSNVIDAETFNSMKSMLVDSLHNASTKKNLSDYDLAKSPEVSSELTARVSQRADYLVHHLTKFGYCIIDGFLGEAKAQKVHWCVTQIQQSGIMTGGELVKKSDKEQLIRGDQIAWMTGKEEQYEYLRLFISATDQLLRHSCRKIKGHVIKGRTPAMVACYPGDGTGYKCHVDNATKDGRCITLLYYLNKGWDSKQHGGALQLHALRNPTPTTIEPIFDRMLVFWSDRRSPHQVLPAYRQRFAITIWYFDEVERGKVKEAYIEKMKNGFSSRQHLQHEVKANQTPTIQSLHQMSTNQATSSQMSTNQGTSSQMFTNHWTSSQITNNQGTSSTFSTEQGTSSRISVNHNNLSQMSINNQNLNRMPTNHNTSNKISTNQNTPNQMPSNYDTLNQISDNTLHQIYTIHNNLRQLSTGLDTPNEKPANRNPLNEAPANHNPLIQALDYNTLNQMSSNQNPYNQARTNYYTLNQGSTNHNTLNSAPTNYSTLSHISTNHNSLNPAPTNCSTLSHISTNHNTLNLAPTNYSTLSHISTNHNTLNPAPTNYSTLSHLNQTSASYNTVNQISTNRNIFNYQGAAYTSNHKKT